MSKLTLKHVRWEASTWQLTTVCAIALLVGVLGAIPAFAQSAGNYTWGSNSYSAHCVLNSNGSITGGQICQENCTLDASGNITCTGDGQGSGLCDGGFAVGLKTSSGSGNVFDIQVGAVVGLLTDVSLAKNNVASIGTSSALAGVDFSVNVTGPGTPEVVPDYPITFASRFVQISSNLFDLLATTCATTTGCYFNFNESTVSAHSYNWVASHLQSGNYIATVNWTSSLGNTGISQALTCTGPVYAGATQKKVFQFNKVNSF